VLLSAIDKDLYDKIMLAKDMIDSVKFYINPQIYAAEKEFEEKGSTEGIHVNETFDKQSAIGHATGKAWVPDYVNDAINSIKEGVKKGKVVRVNLEDPETRVQNEDYDDILG